MAIFAIDSNGKRIKIAGGGVNLPTGGTAGQVLTKASGSDFDTAWADIVSASNPNILDNWYFADPINQRGQTSYTAGYGIDRWYSTGTMSINVSGLTVTQMLKQLIEGGESFNNKSLTMSILFASGELGTVAGVMNMNSDSWDAAKHIDSGWIGLRLQTNGLIDFRYTCEQPTTVIAAKLELGSQQTLAHKEGDTWVPNDPPPNKATELAKCQRYFQGIIVGIEQDLYRNSLRVFGADINYPVKMASNPVAVSNNIFYAPSYGMGGWRNDGTSTFNCFKEHVNIGYILPEGSPYTAEECRLVSRGNTNGIIAPLFLSADL